MAQNNNMLTQDVSGCIGDIIYYKRNGKSYCRRRPQYSADSLSPASRESGAEFSKAVKAAKAIRVSLNGIWPPAKDETTNYRLNKAVYAALRADDAHQRGQRVFTAQALRTHLNGFRYNAGIVQTIANMGIVRQEDGSIRVELSACWQHSLRIPKRAKYMQLLAVSLDMDLVNNTCLQSVTAAGCMPLSDSAATLVLPARAVSSTATIVMVQLRFLREEEGVRTAGATSSEQAFVADVLPPVMTPLVNNRAVKIPRITPNRKTAVDILKSTRPEKGMVDRQTSIRREKEGYESVQEWGCIGNWLVKNERDYAVADRE